MPSLPNVPATDTVIVVVLLIGTFALGWHDPSFARSIAHAVTIVAAWAVRSPVAAILSKPTGSAS